jgi:hypothetical protein
MFIYIPILSYLFVLLFSSNCYDSVACFISYSKIDHYTRKKDTRDTARSASYLELDLKINNKGRLRTKLYDKRDDLNFPIMKFPFSYSSILAESANGKYISQLIRYSRACGSYSNFLEWGLLLTRKLLNQWLVPRGYAEVKMTWLTITEYLCNKWPRKCSICRNQNPVLSPFMTYHRVCNKSNTTDATSGAETAYTSGAPEFIPGFLRGSWCSIISFVDRCLPCSLLSFGHSLYCLSFFVLWLLITPFSIFKHFLIINLYLFNMHSENWPFPMSRLPWLVTLADGEKLVSRG